jgi:hypothetical protein
LPQALHRPAPVDTTSEAHRHAYNAAFQELDLPWHWDERTFALLQPYGRAGVRAWVEQEQPHLLRAYALDFLVDAIEDTKSRCHERVIHAVAVAVAVPAPRLAA